MKNIKTFEELDIKKYNVENMPNSPKTDLISKEYIDSIFSDYIDSDLAYSKYHNRHGEEYEINIKLPINYSSTIESHLKHTKEVYNFFLDIKVCLDRIKDEFPSVSIDITRGNKYLGISIENY